ncbi:MAG: PaaI family thioesterase [Bacteroidales bacterium]|nr:PaaI family thioesterase [Bacteroidales bacterium]HOI33056.1 PaaI family thioesterase [Bacteroidales bacterium]
MKINNPYNKLKEHHCFGCSAKNPIGLKLEFKLEGNQVTAKWNPTRDYQGFEDLLHGGIISTIMDEIAAWAVQVLLHTAGVTSELNVKYLKPVRLSKGAVWASAHIAHVEGRLAKVKTSLKDSSDTICAEGMITYFIYPEVVAQKKFRFPNPDLFLDTK